MQDVPAKTPHTGLAGLSGSGKALHPGSDTLGRRGKRDGMRIGKWARLLFAAAPLLAGCGNFWEAPDSSSTSFSLTNSGNITVAPGATGTSTITVTPGSSFSGSVALTCTVTSTPSSASSPTTCSLSPTSLTLSSSTAQTSTLTADTSSSTTTGAYDITVTGVYSSVAETTSLCVEVTNSSGSCSAASGASGVFYVLNQTTDKIVAMNISSAGKLNTVSTLTLPAPQPLAIAIAPNGKFLYVSTYSGIFLYTINSNGTLTLGNSGGAISSDPATTMQVDATNSWLVDAISGSSQLSAIAINSSTGAEASASESEQLFPSGLPATTPTQLAISPNDSSSCNSCYVFVGMGSNGTEFIHFNPGSANPLNGGFGHIGRVNSSGGDNAVAVDPSNRLLYVGEAYALPSATQSGGLRVFTIASGGVTELTSAGSPYTTNGTGPSAILPSGDGNYVYVANQSVSGSSTGNISSFSVATTGLTSIDTIAAGPSGQLGLAEDSTGSYLFVVDFAGGPDLTAYTMSSGTLTSTLTSTTGSDPVGAIAIAAAP
jgi:6-phosphogluconolactonase